MDEATKESRRTEKKFLENMIAIAAEEYSEASADLGSLLVVSKSRVIYVSPKAETIIKNYADKNNLSKRDAIKEATKTVREVLDSDSEVIAACDRRASLEELPLDIVNLSFNFFNKKDIPSPAQTLFELFASFDHEMGHAVCESSYDFSDPVSESCADNFAALHHIKRFGKNTGFIEEEILRNSDNIVTSDKKRYSIFYYTSPSLSAIKSLSEKTDIDNMSLEENAYYAKNLALLYSLNERRLKKIANAFKKTQKLFEKEKVEDSDKAVVEAMFKHKHDEDIYRAGKLYLSQPTVKGFLTGVFWEKSFAKMEKHEKETGFILDHAAALEKKSGENFVDSLIKHRRKCHEKLV